MVFSGDKKVRRVIYLCDFFCVLCCFYMLFCTCSCEKGACFGQAFEDGEGGGDDDDEEDEDTVDGNVAYASCDLVGAFAKVCVLLMLGW